MRSLASVAPLLLLLGVGLSESGIAGPLEDGLAAYNNYDYCTALKILEPLAEQGRVEAQIRLGLIYHHGSCQTMRDSNKAMKWLRLAADQDNAEAQFVLGNLYWERANYAETVKLYLRSAQHGYVPAQDYLGSMYAYGIGIPADNVQAYFWYDLAAARGEENAAEKRDLIAKKLTPDELVEAQKLAREWKPK